MSHQKKVILQCRVNQEEAEKIHIAAALKGQSLSTFIREKLLTDSRDQDGLAVSLDIIQEYIHSMSQDLSRLKSIVVYLLGKQLNSLDISKINNNSNRNLLDTLPKDVAELCKNILYDSEQD